MNFRCASYLSLFVLIALTVGVLVIFSGSALASAKGCGRVTATRDGATSTYRVEVFRGAVACTDARTVVKEYNSGKGTLHKPPHSGRGSWYTILPGGWSCVSGAGGEACARGPKVNSYQRRDELYATPV